MESQVNDIYYGPGSQDGWGPGVNFAWNLINHITTRSLGPPPLTSLALVAIPRNFEYFRRYCWVNDSTVSQVIRGVVKKCGYNKNRPKHQQLIARAMMERNYEFIMIQVYRTNPRNDYDVKHKILNEIIITRNIEATTRLQNVRPKLAFSGLDLWSSIGPSQLGFIPCSRGKLADIMKLFANNLVTSFSYFNKTNPPSYHQIKVLAAVLPLDGRFVDVNMALFFMANLNENIADAGKSVDVHQHTIVQYLSTFHHPIETCIEILHKFQEHELIPSFRELLWSQFSLMDRYRVITDRDYLFKRNDHRVLQLILELDRRNLNPGSKYRSVAVSKYVFEFMYKTATTNSSSPCWGALEAETPVSNPRTIGWLLEHFTLDDLRDNVIRVYNQDPSVLDDYRSKDRAIIFQGMTTLLSHMDDKVFEEFLMATVDNDDGVQLVTLTPMYLDGIIMCFNRVFENKLSIVITSLINGLWAASRNQDLEIQKQCKITIQTLLTHPRIAYSMDYVFGLLDHVFIDGYIFGSLMRTLDHVIIKYLKVPLDTLDTMMRDKAEKRGPKALNSYNNYAKVRGRIG